MRTDAKNFLADVLGTKMADEVIADTEKLTQQLESQGIRHRADEEPMVLSAEDAGEITGVKQIEEPNPPPAPANAEGEKAVPEYITASHSHEDIEHTHRYLPESFHTHQGVKTGFRAGKMPAKEEESSDSKKEDQAKGEKAAPEGGVDMKALAVGVSTIIDRIGGLEEAVKAIPTLQEDVKSLKATDEERLAAIMQPRWSLPGGIRPTEASNNIADPRMVEGVREQGGDDNREATQPPVNPAQKYVDDLIAPGARIQQG